MQISTHEIATMAEVERSHIIATLEALGGNRTHAAKALKLSVRTIRNRIQAYRTQGFNIPDAPIPHYLKVSQEGTSGPWMDQQTKESA